MNHEDYMRIKQENIHDRVTSAIVDSEVIEIDSDDDTISYSSSSRSSSPEPTAPNAIKNETQRHRTHNNTEVEVIDDIEIFLIRVKKIIANNKLIIEKYKERSKMNLQQNVTNDEIIKREFPITSNAEFRPILDEIILIED